MWRTKQKNRKNFYASAGQSRLRPSLGANNLQPRRASSLPLLFDWRAALLGTMVHMCYRCEVRFSHLPCLRAGKSQARVSQADSEAIVSTLSILFSPLTALSSSPDSRRHNSASPVSSETTPSRTGSGDKPVPRPPSVASLQTATRALVRGFDCVLACCQGNSRNCDQMAAVEATTLGQPKAPTTQPDNREPTSGGKVEDESAGKKLAKRQHESTHPRPGMRLAKRSLLIVTITTALRALQRNPHLPRASCRVVSVLCQGSRTLGAYYSCSGLTLSFGRRDPIAVSARWDCSTCCTSPKSPRIECGRAARRSDGSLLSSVSLSYVLAWMVLACSITSMMPCRCRQSCRFRSPRTACAATSDAEPYTSHGASTPVLSHALESNNTCASCGCVVQCNHVTQCVPLPARMRGPLVKSGAVYLITSAMEAFGPDHASTALVCTRALWTLVSGVYLGWVVA